MPDDDDDDNNNNRRNICIPLSGYYYWAKIKVKIEMLTFKFAINLE